MKTTLDILREALETVSDPGRFTQGAIARNRDGQTCSPISTAAVKWCVVGAIQRAAHPNGLSDPAFLALHKEHGEVSAAIVNNGPDGRRRICAALRRAIKKLEREA